MHLSCYQGVRRRNDQGGSHVGTPAWILEPGQLLQKILFKASGPKLSPLFDGSEQLIGVTSNPWYTRQTFLPAS
jgi:hypothetical protein